MRDPTPASKDMETGLLPPPEDMEAGLLPPPEDMEAGLLPPPEGKEALRHLSKREVPEASTAAPGGKFIR
ncbi:hypothetical protein H4CHR_05340 [Variovorax sp. PBS-H4]|nr:hypothetical protein H4CHR_05340 [Variovorax sp. PBS-H4]